MNKSTIWNIVLAIALAVSLTANAVTWVLWPENTAQTAGNGETTATTTTIPVQKDMTDIQTPYGTLRYPSEYTDYLVCEAEEKDGAYMQVFSYRRGEETVEMFRVHFASGEVPALLGYVEHEGGSIAVGISSAEYTPDAGWSADDADRFRAMSMAVNDVIASVQAWDNYVG